MLQLEDIHYSSDENKGILALSAKKLRNTVFWTLLQNSVIFDTEANAIEYRQFTIRMNTRCPNLFSMDGKFIPSSGIMDSSHGQLKDIDLKYVFGSKPKNPQIKELEQGMKLYSVHCTID